MAENYLYYGDNLEVLRKYIKDESIDLCYIFRVARRLNVQVFATTHSWDCIEAFQKAASTDKQAEGFLIRLESKLGDIVATAT